MIALDQIIVLESVEKIERVLDPYAVGIALERRLEVLAPLVDLAKPQFVVAQHAPRGPILRIERRALPGEVSRLLIEPQLARDLRQRPIELGVAGIRRECALP